MPSIALDAIGQLAGWQALQADGVTPSAAIAIAEDNASVTPGGDQHSLTFAFADTAQDHLAQCTIAAADLDDSDELRLVLRADRASAPGFYLELRLGSAAMPIQAPGNDWHRRIPIANAGQWDVVRVSLSDLPAPVRDAVTAVRLQCIDAGRAFTLAIDEVLAVRPAMVVDLEQALHAQLHERVSLAGTPVPAALVTAGGAWPAATPCIAIVPLDVRHLTERSGGAAQRCDFVADGYRLRPSPVPYEAVYAIEPVATARADQAVLMDFLLRTIAPLGVLRVAANAWSIEALPPPAVVEQDPNLTPAPRQRLYCRVLAWRDTDAPSSVQPVQGIVTQLEWKESGHG